MRKKATHQELYIVLKIEPFRRKKIIRKCCDFIEDFGGDIMDICRYEPVVTTVISLKYISRLKSVLRKSELIETIIPGLKLLQNYKKDSDAPKYKAIC